MNLSFKIFLEMGMKSISSDNKEIVTIRDGNTIRSTTNLEKTLNFNPIYINIFKDSSQNELVAKCEVFPVLGTKYYQLHIFSNKGYGPLLYDIAIEYVTLKGKSLIPSTSAGIFFADNSLGFGGATSDEASEIYKYYYEKRHDVIKTKIKYDKSNIKFDTEEMSNTPWLFCAYSKDPVTINALKAYKKIFINQEINKSHDFIRSDGFRFALADRDMEDLIDYYIDNTPELQNKYEVTARDYYRKDRPFSKKMLHLIGRENSEKLINLVYTYIRRFFQIKNQDYVKEKNIKKYTWKELVDLVDYRQNKKLF